MTIRTRDRAGNLKVQLDLPAAAAERLLRFQAYMECSTYSETIRNLLKVSDELMSIRESGYEIVARAPDGSSFPIFNMVKP